MEEIREEIREDFRNEIIEPVECSLMNIAGSNRVASSVQEVDEMIVKQYCELIK